MVLLGFGVKQDAVAVAVGFVELGKREFFEVVAIFF